MAVEGREGNIKCPVLLTTGEYDARSPVELVYKFYDNIKGPKELWVYEDTYHWTNLFPGTNENADSHNMGRDWIPRRSPASSSRATRARRSCAPAAVDRMAPKVSTRTRGTGGSKRRRLRVSDRWRDVRTPVRRAQRTASRQSASPRAIFRINSSLPAHAMRPRPIGRPSTLARGRLTCGRRARGETELMRPFFPTRRHVASLP